MDDQTPTIEDTNYFDTPPKVPTSRFHVPVPQQLAVLAFILFIIFVGATGSIVASLKNTPLIGDAISHASPEGDAQATATVNEADTTFFDITLTGRAAFVWDVKGQRALFKKNENEVLPLASVTKLMTALVASEILSEKEDVTISDAALRQDGDSGLLARETFSRQSLSNFVLMSSSNDGAYALAAAAGNALLPNDGAHAFVEAMNIRAKEIGLTNTTFKNPTGLDLSTTESGANGSAKDMAFLMEYIVKNAPDLLAFTKEDIARMYSEDGISHDAQNTNYYIDEIPGLIGSKTGYTDLAGGNLVIAFNAGLDRPIVVVVLGSSRHDRFTDVVALANEAQRYIAMQSR